MNAQKIAVKLFLADPASLHHGALVPVFHQWIQAQAVEEHLTVDVTDYEHVPSGPGTVLVCHEGNFYGDSTDGRPGLMYQRKQPLPGDFSDRLTTVLRHTLLAAARLESHPGLKFRTDELTIKIADRLLAPNTAETFAAVRDQIESALTALLGPVALTRRTEDPAKLFEVAVVAKSNVTVAELLEKLPAAAVR